MAVVTYEMTLSIEDGAGTTHWMCLVKVDHEAVGALLRDRIRRKAFCVKWQIPSRSMHTFQLIALRVALKKISQIPRLDGSPRPFFRLIRESLRMAMVDVSMKMNSCDGEAIWVGIPLLVTET